LIGHFKILEKIGEGAAASFTWPSSKSRFAGGWLLKIIKLG